MFSTLHPYVLLCISVLLCDVLFLGRYIIRERVRRQAVLRLLGLYVFLETVVYSHDDSNDDH